MSEAIGPVVPLTKDGRVECPGCLSKCAVGGGEYIGLNKEGGFYRCYICGEKWPKPFGCTCNTFDTGYHMSSCKLNGVPPTAPESCPKCGHPPCKSKVCLGHCIDQISGSMVICDCDCQSPTLPSTPAETGRWKPDDVVAEFEVEGVFIKGGEDGKEELPFKKFNITFKGLKPEVQRALNGKSDEKWEKLKEWLWTGAGVTEETPRSAKSISDKMRELEYDETLNKLQQEGTK